MKTDHLKLKNNNLRLIFYIKEFWYSSFNLHTILELVEFDPTHHFHCKLCSPLAQGDFLMKKMPELKKRSPVLLLLKCICKIQLHMGFLYWIPFKRLQYFQLVYEMRGFLKSNPRNPAPLKMGKVYSEYKPQQHNGQLPKLANRVKIPRSTSVHYIKLGNEIYSTIRTPNDHQSALWLWPRLFTTSGAMYSTVPQKE